MPPRAQEEVLDAVEDIEERYSLTEIDTRNGDQESKYVLSLIAELAIDGPPDLAERHDFYAHGNLED